MAKAEKPGAADAAPEEALAVDTQGQITLPLDGQDWILRPSRKAISACERQLRPLFELAQSASSGSLTIEEMAVIAAEMMRSYGAANPQDELASSYTGAKVERLADLIHEAGPPRICVRLMIVLSGALNGGYTAEGEAKPATGTA